MPLRWRRPRSTKDFADEVRAHIDLETDRLTSEGLQPGEARRIAIRAFGNVVTARERFHESRTWLGVPLALCESVWRDVHHAARGVARTPGVCAVVALTLSLGVGVGASLLTVFTGLFLRPNVTHDASSFIKLFVSTTGGQLRSERGEPWAATLEEFEAIQQGSHTLASVTASAWATFRLSDEGAAPLRGLWVSCNYLRAHVPAIVSGRSLSDADCDSGSAPVAVLSAHAWIRAFGGAANVVGRHVVLNGVAVEIVGVVPDIAVRHPVAAEVFVPYPHRSDSIQPGEHVRRGQEAWLSLSGRLAPGGTPAAVEREVRQLVDPLNRLRGRTSSVIVTNGAAVFDPSAGKYLPMIVSAASVAILLILVLGCANAAMLLLARAVSREGEWAMRLRLGAPPARIVRQVLVESAVVALPAWGIGVGLAYFLPGRVLSRMTEFPLGLDVSPDSRVWVLTGALTVAAGVLTGVAAARHAAAAPLTAGAGTVTPRSHVWLLAPQLATCVVLATGAATLSAHQRQWSTPNVAYDPRDVAIATMRDDGRGSVGGDLVSLALRLADSLRRLPGITHTALASPGPFAGDMRTLVRSPRDETVATSVRIVSPEYFALAQVETRRGRLWERTDGRLRSNEALQVVISEALSLRLEGVDPPARLRFHDGRVATVVGVVADTVSLRPDATDGPLLYLPAGTSPTPEINVLARGSAVTSALAGAVRQSWTAANEPRIETLATVLARSGASYRTGRDVLGAVAALALLLAAVGTGGAVAFQLRRRRREAAVRLALGATRVELFTLNVARAAAPVASGVLAGVGLSLLLSLAWPSSHVGPLVALHSLLWPVLVVTAAAVLGAAVASARAVRAAAITALREG